MKKEKEKLLAVVKEAVDLLMQCGLEDKAGWFRTSADHMRILEEKSAEFRDELLKIKGILVGMGSFSDVPMYPKHGASITRQEAREMQWNITSALGESIDVLLAGRSGSKDGRGQQDGRGQVRNRE